MKRILLFTLQPITTYHDFSVNCTWDQWTGFSECSKSCGEGTKTRTRQKIIEEEFGGSCQGTSKDTTSCNIEKCPEIKWKFNCIWGTWSAFSECTESCGEGTKTRSRKKILKESNGGTCKGTTTDTTYCNIKNCPGKLSLNILFSML